MAETKDLGDIYQDVLEDMNQAVLVDIFQDVLMGYVDTEIRQRYEKSFKRMERRVKDMLEERAEDAGIDTQVKVRVLPEIRFYFE